MTKMKQWKYNIRGIVTYLKERPEVLIYFSHPAHRAEFGYIRLHLSATQIGIRRTLKVVKSYRKYGNVDFVSDETGEILFMIGC